MLQSSRFLALLVFFTASMAPHAQVPQESSSSLPQAPSAHQQPVSLGPGRKPAHTPDGAYEHLLRLNVSCGGGLGKPGTTANGGVGMCGGGFTIIPSVVTELGVMGPLSGPAHFYVSEDFIAPLTHTIKRLHGQPLGLVGYTKIVGNSNRFDYGIGWDHHLGDGQSLAFEARDYMQLDNTIQHIVMFRISFAIGGDWD